MAALMETPPFTAVEYEGGTHDGGEKISLLRANIAVTLKRTDLGVAAG